MFLWRKYLFPTSLILFQFYYKDSLTCLTCVEMLIALHNTIIYSSVFSFSPYSNHYNICFFILLVRQYICSVYTGYSFLLGVHLFLCFHNLKWLFTYFSLIFFSNYNVSLFVFIFIIDLICTIYQTKSYNGLNSNKLLYVFAQICRVI